MMRLQQQQQQQSSGSRLSRPTTSGGFDHLWPDAHQAHNGNSALITKDGLTWNSSLLLAGGAKLIDLNLYDLCPYSGPLIDASAASNLLSPAKQQILISVAVIFILISLCLLMMLVYFGDTQTILAFTYIHMNPIYRCLRLNESHLDGDKLYDAFVSYTDADRDIVMALVEKLEQQQQRPAGPTLNNRRPASDKLESGSQEALVGGDFNGRPDGLRPSETNNNNQLQSTLKRASSRITINGDTTGSAHDLYASKSTMSSSGDDPQPVNALGNKPYRLCIHERDWLPGHLISWNIVNSVQNSRRTILILSKDFIKSTWFQVEFQTAYYQMIEDKIDRLIVIVRGELPPKHELDKNLAFLLTTKTYLKWGDKWFWERLHYALPHRVTSPTMVAGKPLKQHHHRAPKQAPMIKQQQQQNGTTTSNNNRNSSSSGELLSSGGQKPLIMSSIGKDCSNLLLPVHHNTSSSSSLLIRSPQDSSTPATTTTASNSSSSSHGSSVAGARSSASSSFLSGAGGGPTQTTATTSNDLLSAGGGGASTTRLTIGPSASRASADINPNNSSAATLADSGRVTATLSSSSSLLATPVGGGGGVTNIMLNGKQQQDQLQAANSRARQKKQEKLHSFVEQTIADRFNLSEL